MLTHQCRIGLAAFALLFAVLACNLPSNATATSIPPAPVVPTQLPAQPSPVAPTQTVMPAAEPSVAASATLPPTVVPVTSTASLVTVTASTGNLNIRRGPDAAYNPISALLKGQSSTAAARDDKGDWINIAIPSAPGQSGWVSTRTQYTTVQGDVMSLPVVTVDPPKPAYFRNCTFHPMIVDPGGKVIPPQTDSPNNKVQFNPGDYVIKDGSVSGNPTVMEATLLEGYSIDIRTDGIPNTYSCP